MITIRWLRALAVVAVTAAVAVPSRIAAQGTTTAAISGTVTDSTTKEPVEAAQVQIVSGASGASVTVQTRPSGLYFVSGLQVGEPYTVTVRRIGFRPKSDKIARLSLSQRAVLDFQLIPQAATLAAITVEAGNQLSPVINPNRKGTGSLVDDSILKRAPTLNRNFTDFMSTVPQVATQPNGSTSAGGVNNRYNNIQIDGANSNDMFGLGSTGQPGGQSNGKSISLDAVKEYQVLLSPYDLNFSGFNGALVNAVTKSGTNEFDGDIFYYFRNQNYAANVPFIQNSGLYVEQYGASVSGPIIKDRLQFFANGEWQLRAQPSTGPYIGQAPGAASPLTVDSATTQRFINDLTALGIPAGTGGATNNANPLTNAFGRLDLALPEINSTLTLRDNYAGGSIDVFSRTSTFPLTSQLYTINNNNNSLVLQLNSTMQSGSSNEFIAAYQTISDLRLPIAGQFPTINVTVPGLQSATISELGGAEQFSQGNSLQQKMLQLKDNYSFFVGDNNRVTAGVSAELWQFTNLFTESSYGVWTFNSLDSLEAGNANRYRVSLPLTNPPAIVAQPQGVTYGAYVENNWTPNPNFNMVFGLRIDVPVITNSPPYTASFDSIFGGLFQSMGRQANTSQVPSGNIQWEPRVGFNWDLDGEKKNQIRGGAGVFVGRPAMVWVANSWQNSGSGLGFLMCGRSDRSGSDHAGIQRGIRGVAAADVSERRRHCGRRRGSGGHHGQQPQVSRGLPRESRVRHASAGRFLPDARGTVYARAEQLLLRQPQHQLRLDIHRPERPLHVRQHRRLGRAHHVRVRCFAPVLGSDRHREPVEGLRVRPDSRAAQARVQLARHARGVHVLALVRRGVTQFQPRDLQLAVRPRGRRQYSGAEPDAVGV